MPKFVIEREIAGAGALSERDLKAAAQNSCRTLRDLPQVQWQQSYVTGDKLYCVYIAPDAQQIEEHARLSGFPANRISQVMHVIDPTTAE